MAGERKSDFKSPKSKTGASANDQAVEIFFLILVLVAVFAAVANFAANRNFRGILNSVFPSNSLEDVNSPVGENVILSRDTNVTDEPGGSILGFQSLGASGIVIRGPEVSGTERHWYIDFTQGQDGFVPESVLVAGNGRAFDPGDTPVGSRISAAPTTSGTIVYGIPGGQISGTAGPNARGLITKGPIYYSGNRYWFILLDNGLSGWVNESDLRFEDGANFDPGDTPVGYEVSTTRDSVNVFEIPGGRRIGGQALGVRGIVSRGPFFNNGNRFWFVQFESGPSGWVNEDDLILVGRESLFSKIVGWVMRTVRLISTVLTLLFLSGIIYSVIRISQIVSERNKKIRAVEHPEGIALAQKEFVNRRWERVLVHIQSDNPADWRLAVLESDIMLAELLERMGYIGENVGEKLKRIEKSDFKTIDDAWEAHKVRNIIAHQGSDFVLSKREAQRVVSLFANVFREFRYIGAGEMPPESGE